MTALDYLYELIVSGSAEDFEAKGNASLGRYYSNSSV